MLHAEVVQLGRDSRLAGHLSKHIHISRQGLTPYIEWVTQGQFSSQQTFPPNIVIPETGYFYRSLG